MEHQCSLQAPLGSAHRAVALTAAFQREWVSVLLTNLRGNHLSTIFHHCVLILGQSGVLAPLGIIRIQPAIHFWHRGRKRGRWSVGINPSIGFHQPLENTFTRRPGFLRLVRQLAEARLVQKVACITVITICAFNHPVDQYWSLQYRVG